MLDWWRSLSQKNQIALVIGIIGAVSVLIIALNTSITQTTNGGHALKDINGDVHIGDKITNNYGISLEDHEESLRKREAEIREELAQKHVKNREQLEIQLRAVQQQLQDSKASYEAHIASLKEQIARLEAMRDEVPDALLNEAIEALKQGKTQKADALFKHIEDDGEDQIKLIAEAAYQRGKIAHDAIRYLDALVNQR